MIIDDQEMMRALAKMALEQATASLAQQARDFALTLPKEIDGQTALMAFADAIMSTNAKVWPAANKVRG